MRADGFEVNVVPFDVIYTTPTQQRLQIVSAPATELDLLEGQPGHHTAAEKMAGPAFMENSGDGDVTGPIFYLNHGMAEDWARVRRAARQHAAGLDRPRSLGRSTAIRTPARASTPS